MKSEIGWMKGSSPNWEGDGGPSLPSGASLCDADLVGDLKSKGTIFYTNCSITNTFQIIYYGLNNFFLTLNTELLC